MSSAPSSVAVVVLGDVGRSPRMQYHCASLAALGPVSLVGFRGEKCVPNVENNANITKYLMGQPFAGLPRSLFLLWAPLKVVFQVLQLFFLLAFWIPRPRAYLVQNPPSIPALLVVWLAARLRGAKFIIDWHNFGFTVLYLSLKGRHKWLVNWASRYEIWFAQRADGHLCVTNAMRIWLATHWRVQATVLYDKPPAAFHKASLEEKHDLFTRLTGELNLPPSSSASSSSSSSLAAPPAAAANPGSTGSTGSRRSPNSTPSNAGAASSNRRTPSPSPASSPRGGRRHSLPALHASSFSTLLTEIVPVSAATPVAAAASSASGSASGEKRRQQQQQQRQQQPQQGLSLKSPTSITLPGAPLASLQLGPAEPALSPPGTPGVPSPQQPQQQQQLGLSSAASSASDDRLPSSTSAASPSLVLPPGYVLRERLDEGRPAIIVSSTSWTEDEDFGVLLEALVEVDGAISSPALRGKYPNLLVIVTGKGPQKEFYLKKIAALQMKRVTIRTLWLSPSDYPLILGSADLGVCLHTSTSGLDLPMKVVDMFGSGLPVCAIDFSCLGELVKHDVNGLIFKTSEQLRDQLLALFEGFPAKNPSKQILERLARGVRQFQSERWQDNWEKRARPFFTVEDDDEDDEGKFAAAGRNGAAASMGDEEGPNSSAIRSRLRAGAGAGGGGEGGATRASSSGGGGGSGGSTGAAGSARKRR